VTAAKQLYLMEHEAEGDRLLIKGDQASTASQLIDAGFTQLPKNPTIVDAGCGVGFVSGVMSNLCHKTYEQSTIQLVDLSAERLKQAKSHLPKHDSVHYDYVCSPLEEIRLPCNSADFVYSRFVFEYLKNQVEVFRELKRIVKPGGKLFVADLDYNCLNHYPIDAKLEQQLHEITDQLHTLNLLDAFAGRKLFSYFSDHGFKDIKVRVEAHHLFCGRPGEAELYNWLAKIDQMESLQKQDKINLSFNVATFRNEFMEFLQQDNRFSYTPIIIVEGVKA
jgi:ubiquinone/menaquinone biosynthesis C-methylase UbiE